MSESNPTANQPDGLRNLLSRVVMGAKEKAGEAAFRLMGWETPTEGPDYLKPTDDDYDFVMAFIDSVKDKPEDERKGWEEIHLPRAVYQQCVKDEAGEPLPDADGNIQPRITHAQAERLLATLTARARRDRGYGDGQI